MSDTYGTNPLVRICRDFALAGERRDLSDGPAWIRTRDRRIMSRGERPDRRRSREIMQFLEPLPGLRLGRRVPVRLRRAGSHTGPRRRPAFPPSNVFRQMKCPRLDRQHRGPHRPGTLRVVDPALPRVLGMPKAVYVTRRRRVGACGRGSEWHRFPNLLTAFTVTASRKSAPADRPKRDGRTSRA
jgi:hypothetical protein